MHLNSRVAVSNRTAGKRCRRSERGISIVEVVVVISILLIILATMFALSGPLREKGNEKTCMSNMKQIYQGDLMYAEASDSGSAYPELHGLSYVPSLDSQRMAFRDPDILWCPSAPDVYRSKLGISYSSALWFDPRSETGGISASRARVIEREKEQGAVAPIVECTAHDEFYYAQQEKDVDNYVARPFKVYLRLDGSVVARRFQTTRDFPISGTIK